MYFSKKKSILHRWIEIQGQILSGSTFIVLVELDKWINFSTSVYGRLKQESKINHIYCVS